MNEKPRYKLTRYLVEWYYITFDRKPDEALALDAWRGMVKATGRSAVGKPKLVSEYDIDHNKTAYYVAGKVIDNPNFKGKIPFGARSVVIPERNERRLNLRSLT